MKNQIQILAQAIHNDVVSYRRYLHIHPELSFEEYNTMRYISSVLADYGIEHETGVVNTGVIGWIRGRNPESKLIALRADTDALPIDEMNDVSYCSQTPGVMHACGHDVHTASLLGTARILNQIRDQFEGTIMLIFQPAEEKLPGGAQMMLEAGIFDKHKPDLILAQHVQPSLETGKIGFRAGQYMASCDEFYLTIRGKGGHGAIPHQVKDSILAASHIIVAMQQIVSRNAETNTPTVLSFGKVIANGATNIIPGEVKIEGTFRTVDEAWRADAHIKMEEMARLMAESMGCTSEFHVIKGEPVLINDELVTAQARYHANELLGYQNVVKLNPLMTSEDFAHFTHKFPCTYYRLGVQKKNSMVKTQHSSTFDVDEDALLIGTSTMAWLAYRFMDKKAEIHSSLFAQRADFDLYQPELA